MDTAADRLLTSDAHRQELDDLPLAAEDVVVGSPRAGLAELGPGHGQDVGVWELTAGTVTDTEVDEIFVVLSGSGTVAFEDGSVLPLRPGTVARLHAGDRTTWTIEETVRKVYLTPRAADR